MTDDGGRFGKWVSDESGLPCFDVAPRLEPTLVVPDGGARAVWHQVGNDRVIATAHAGGWTTVYFCDRGFLRLSATDPRVPERLGGGWTVPDAKGDPLLHAWRDAARISPRFGAGYARWQVAGENASLTRTVWAPFGDVPALRIDVELQGTGAAFYEESWDASLHALLLGGLMTRWSAPPASHTPGEKLVWRAMMAASSLSRSATEVLRRAYAGRLRRTLRFAPELGADVLQLEYCGPFKARNQAEPGWFDSYPKPIFLAALMPAGAESRSTTGRLALRVALDGRTKLSFAIGSARESEIGALIERLREARREDTAAQWKAALRLEMSGEPALARECTWHAYYLRSGQVRDDYFEATILPQGSAYSYVHGLHGAIRDYALAAVPLTLLDPRGARDTLRLIMRMTRPDGMMYYAHGGFGKCSSAAIHDAPTDLPLFLLWALSEHLWLTGDHEFLDESLPFYPKDCGRRSSVRERVLLAWQYLRDRVRIGLHGMLRVGSGDWSDPISAMVRSRRAFHRDGESGFNTAMAVYVLPRAAALLEPSHAGVAREIRDFTAQLRAAMEAAWTGRWFLRGWDGEGHPIGAEHLFLDCQVWALIAGIGSSAQRRRLVEEIRALLDDPSPIGATILDRPHRIRCGILGRGWDCNGGVWAAINGLLAWAYALHDPALAWRNLHKQSLAAHARAYPHVWYGIWSGPDAYNAHYADRAGETFVHPATPMNEFPVMNSNAHALPLLALMRICGIDTSAAGITLSPRLPSSTPWRLDTPLLSVCSDGRALHGTTRAVGGIGGRAAIAAGSGSGSQLASGDSTAGGC